MPPTAPMNVRVCIRVGARRWEDPAYRADLRVRQSGCVALQGDGSHVLVQEQHEEL